MTQFSIRQEFVGNKKKLLNYNFVTEENNCLVTEVRYASGLGETKCLLPEDIYCLALNVYVSRLGTIVKSEK